MRHDASRRPDRAVAVRFGCQGAGREVGYAALFPISNESSCVNAPAMFLHGGHLAGMMRD
jgi:hypothetical protein